MAAPYLDELSEKYIPLGELAFKTECFVKVKFSLAQVAVEDQLILEDKRKRNRE
jgi:hypothetical protein